MPQRERSQLEGPGSPHETSVWWRGVWPAGSLQGALARLLGGWAASAAVALASPFPRPQSEAGDGA